MRVYDERMNLTILQRRFRCALITGVLFFVCAASAVAQGTDPFGDPFGLGGGGRGGSSGSGSRPAELVDPDGPNPPLRENPPMLFMDREGDFVVLRDDRFGETTYIGLCYLGGNQLLLRLWVPATETEVLMSQAFYVAAGTRGVEVDPGAVRLYKGDPDATIEGKRFLPVIYNWMNASLKARSRFEYEPSFSWQAGTGLDGEDIYLFEYWIPILGMAGMVRGRESTVSMVTAGSVTSMEDPAFFRYYGEPVPEPGPQVMLQPVSPHEVRIGGVDFILDELWKNDGRAWVIAEKTNHDAYLMVEQLDISSLPGIDPFDLIRLTLLFNQGTVLLPDVRLFTTDDGPGVQYRVYDPETRRVTVQIKLFRPDGDIVTVVSLGAFESVYLDNRDYFETLLF